MDWIVDLVNRMPAVITVTLVAVVAGVAGIVVYRALKEGREVSFWPPKIGQRPAGYASVKEKPSSDQLVSEGSRGILKVVLPIDQIAYLSLVSGSEPGSANGTFVNGQKVGYEPYEVEDKDMIEGGGASFMFHVTSGLTPSKEMTGGSGRTVVVSRPND